MINPSWLYECTAVDTFTKELETLIPGSFIKDISKSNTRLSLDIFKYENSNSLFSDSTLLKGICFSFISKYEGPRTKEKMTANNEMKYNNCAKNIRPKVMFSILLENPDKCDADSMVTLAKTRGESIKKSG